MLSEEPLAVARSTAPRLRRVKGVAALSFAIAALGAVGADPALAHGPGGAAGAAAFPLVVAAVALVAAGLAARGKASNAFVPWALVAAGVAVGAGGLVAVSQGSDRPDVHVSIVEPKAGARVPAGEPVDVRVLVDGPLASGADDTEGGHLRLLVDGLPRPMPNSREAQVTLRPGPHEITVEYVDNDRVSYRPKIAATVQVTAR